ncbi:hypothetical protein Ancab_022002 [Ancistrocladus abbreviatus]
MDGNPFVLDVSSDEELGFTEPTTDYFDWLAKFFEDEDEGGKNGGSDDSDDVVIVREVLADPKKVRKSLHAFQKDDDADCVVLDGDPDKPVTEDNDSGSGSDDLIIVGEKGQVACRDYPHSRHQCANFPFNSTPHDGHCNLCHCYVCDCPAPCSFWGNGVSHTDHCHATDKEEFWKLERDKVRQGKSAPPPQLKLSGAYISTAQHVCNQVLSRPQLARHNASVSTAQTLYDPIPPATHAARSNVSASIVLTPYNRGAAPPQGGCASASVSTAQPSYNRVPPPLQLAHNSVSQSQAPIPPSTGDLHSSFGVPNIISQRRTQRPNLASARSRLQPIVSQQMLNPCNSSLLWDRHPISGRFFGSRPTFKRRGIPGRSLGTHQSVYSPSDDFSLAYSPHLNVHLAAKPIEANPIRLPESSPLEDLEPFLLHEASSMLNQSQISMGNVHPQPQQYGQPPQPSDSSFSHNQTQNFAAPCFSHSTTLLDSTVQSSQQALGEISQSGDAITGSDFLPMAEQHPTPFPVIASPGTMDFGFENWLLENQSVLGADEGPLFPEMNYPSTISAPIDAGIPHFD